jgi:hypothetical protein
MRYALAVVVVAVAVAVAVAVRGYWSGRAPEPIYGGSPYAGNQPYLGMSGRVSRPAWVNPVALLIAGAGLAFGVGLVARNDKKPRLSP